MAETGMVVIQGASILSISSGENLMTYTLPDTQPSTTVDSKSAKLYTRSFLGSRRMFCPFQVAQSRSGLIPNP